MHGAFQFTPNVKKTRSFDYTVSTNQQNNDHYFVHNLVILFLSIRVTVVTNEMNPRPPFLLLLSPSSVPHHIAFPELAMRDRRDAAAADTVPAAARQQLLRRREKRAKRTTAMPTPANIPSFTRCRGPEVDVRGRW